MNKNCTHNDKQTSVTRRRFLSTTAVAAAAAALPVASIGRSSVGIIVRPSSTVKIGAISYSFRSLPTGAEDVLGYLMKCGLNTVELMGDTAERFAGAPAGPGFPRNFREMDDEERAKFRQAREEAAKESAKWRPSAPMTKFKQLGEMYRDAGIEIDILKLGDPRWSDAEIDYAFKAARAVGARGISFEISNEAAERMAPFAQKHEMYIGMHNHTQVADEGFSFDTPLSHSSYNMLNLDIGHYVAGLGTSPIPTLKKYHDRITHLHLKDRKTPDNGGDNVAWGDGDTPIGEVLRLIQKEGYPITGMIELEYDVPEYSDVITEVAKCAAFCRGALS